jgi:hypothetical protein
MTAKEMLMMNSKKKKKIKLYDGTEMSEEEMKKYDDRHYWTKAKKK